MLSPCSDWVLPSCVVLASSCIASSLSLPTVRVLCHSIVGLGLCLCDRVVSLWNSGDGLCGVEGCVVSTVHCQLLCVVVCVLCCGLWNGGVCVWVCGLVACLPLLPVFLFFFLLLVFGVVRAQPCEHARYPEHHCVFDLLFPFSFLCAPPFFVSLSPPAFLLLEWRCVIHHVSVCLVGMTATGSLSRSSPFFW